MQAEDKTGHETRIPMIEALFQDHADGNEPGTVLCPCGRGPKPPGPPVYRYVGRTRCRCVSGRLWLACLPGLSQIQVLVGVVAACLGVEALLLCVTQVVQRARELPQERRAVRIVQDLA